ncbi:MAG TPA: HEPN domain-containing protein [Armatimonadetes bacterium]|nr:HEPN domain-containing protein [Armatimonadota bacterium]
MASRHEDWFRQAQRDLDHARYAQEEGHYEWACFAAQQAAEKAVRALYQKLGADAWGHMVSELLQRLPPQVQPLSDLIEMGKELDKHYIPPRYANAYPSGAPMDYYTEGEAQRAIEHAKRILQFCENHLV